MNGTAREAGLAAVGVRASPRRTVSATELAARLGLPEPTPEQREVIEAPLTSMLVVAGAGSGKTETMAARVVWLAVNGIVEPAAVLGMTFTRKAARELRERVVSRLAALAKSQVGAGCNRLGPGAATAVAQSQPDVQTYHAYAARLLSEYGLLAGLEPDARLLSAAGAWQLAHEVVSTYDGPMGEVDLAASTVTRAVLALSDELAEHLCGLDEAVGWSAELMAAVEGLPAGCAGKTPATVRRLAERTAARRQILGVVDTYRRVKRARGCLDFADQLELAARLVTTHQWVAERERERRGLVLLDEFQDTSAAQLTMLRALYGEGTAGDGHPIDSGMSPRFDPADPRGAGHGALLQDEDGGVFEATGGRSPRSHGFDPRRAANGDPARARSVPVIAVGDPHQSIYGWRGAGADALGRFARVFAPPEGSLPTRTLSTSWRNAERVLTVANRVAATLPAAGGVPLRRLVPAPGAPLGSVELARCSDDDAEATLVARWIRARRTSRPPGTRPGQAAEPAPLTAAVLCRRREQIPVLAAALRAEGLPVEEVGVGGLTATPEVAHLIAALCVTHDPDRNDAMLHLLMEPPVRLGVADLDAIGAWSRQLAGPSSAAPWGASDAAATGRRSGLIGVGSVPPTEAYPSPDAGEDASLAEAVVALPPRGWRGPEGERLGERARRRLGRLGTALARLSSLAALPVPELVHAAEGVLALDVEAASRPLAEAQAATAQLRRFREVVTEFAESAAAPSLGGLLAWLEAAREEERGLALEPSALDPTAVQVSTIHAAKGLEWDLVAVPGLIEGRFPATRVGAAQYRDAAWTVRAARDPGWTADVGALPGDLRADRDALPAFGWRRAVDLSDLAAALDAFAAEHAEHGLVEERRLMYVATTRARRALLLTAPVWVGGATPRVTSRFLDELGATAVAAPGEAAPGEGTSGEATSGVDGDAGAVRVLHWEPMPGEYPALDACGANARTGGPHTEVHGPSAGRPVAPESSWPSQAPAAPALQRAAALVARWQDGGDRNPGLDDVKADPGDAAVFRALDRQIAVLLAERDNAGAPDADHPRPELGSLSTSVLVERHKDPGWRAEDAERPVPHKPMPGGRAGRSWHRWIERYYRCAGLFSGDAGVVEAWGTSGSGTGDVNAVDAAAVAAFLAGPWASRVPVALELPFDTLVGGVPVRGRIDAVFSDDDGGFVVVDWKTGRPPTGAAAAAQALQLAVYRAAYARLAGLEPDRVRACFCYAGDGSTVYPPLPDLDALQVFVDAAARL